MIDGKWINQDGFLTLYPNENHIPGEGNGWLHTGLASCLGIYDPGKERVFEMIAACRKSAENPLIFRSPHKRNPGDAQEADDYWGALYLAKKYDSLWPLEVLEYAEKNGWDFDIQGNKNLRFRFDRLPHFVPILRIAAGIDLGIWDQVQLAVIMFYDAFASKKPDGHMKARLRMEIAKDYPFSQLALFIWKRRTKGTNPWAKYFLHPEHPLKNIVTER